MGKENVPVNEGLLKTGIREEIENGMKSAEKKNIYRKINKYSKEKVKTEQYLALGSKYAKKIREKKE